MTVYIYISIYTYLFVYICLFVFYSHVKMNVYVCVLKTIYIYIYIDVLRCIQFVCSCIYIYAYICNLVYTYTHVIEPLAKSRKTGDCQVMRRSFEARGPELWGRSRQIPKDQRNRKLRAI